MSCSSGPLCEVTSHPSAIFEETTDSGRTWTARAGPRLLTSLIDAPVMACLSASSCLAVAADSYSPAGAAESYATTDGGRTWATERMPADFVPYELRCPSRLDCIVSGFYQSPSPPGSSGRDMTTPAGTVLYSTDGGGTWKTASLPGELGSLGAISCATADDCLALFSGRDGRASTALSSRDAGETWTSVPASRLPAGVVLAISCPANGHCWAAGVTGSEASGDLVSLTNGGSALLTSTSDGGRTWQPALVAGVKQVVSVSCPATTKCYALGFERSRSSGMSSFSVVLLSHGS
jgi:photosystem II stability/assembly factor-like uncharacterized protein